MACNAILSRTIPQRRVNATDTDLFLGICFSPKFPDYLESCSDWVTLINPRDYETLRQIPLSTSSPLTGFSERSGQSYCTA